MQAELVLNCRNQHSEGVQWNTANQHAWWTDIEGRRLRWYAPAKSESGHLDRPDGVCCFAPRTGGATNEGTGAAYSSVIRVDPEGHVETLIEGVPCANSTCRGACV